MQVEPADEQATGDIDKRAQEGQEGLGGGIDKQQRPPIAQALQGEGFFAALEVAGQGAVGKAAAAIVSEGLDHAAAEIKRAKAHGDLGAFLDDRVGGVHAEEAAALDAPSKEPVGCGIEICVDDPAHVQLRESGGIGIGKWLWHLKRRRFSVGASWGEE